jgi:hypothetical protein
MQHCHITQSDKDILEHIVYDLDDQEMMEGIKPSIEEAHPISTQELALDYIGKRASQVCIRLRLCFEGFRGCQGWRHTLPARKSWRSTTPASAPPRRV